MASAGEGGWARVAPSFYQDLMLQTKCRVPRLRPPRPGTPNPRRACSQGRGSSRCAWGPWRQGRQTEGRGHHGKGLLRPSTAPASVPSGNQRDTQQAPSRRPEASWPFLVFIGGGSTGGHGVVLTLPEEVCSCDLLNPERSGHLGAWPSELHECTCQPPRPLRALEAEGDALRITAGPARLQGLRDPRLYI